MLVVISNPRMGSSALCEYIGNISPLKNYREVLNGEVEGGNENRDLIKSVIPDYKDFFTDSQLPRYLDYFKNKECVIKLQIDQIRYTPNGFNIVKEFLREPEVKSIFLKRNSLFEQSLSFMVALHRNRWVNLKGHGKLDKPITIPNKLIWDAIHCTSGSNRRIDQLASDLNNIPARTIYYEDMFINGNINEHHIKSVLHKAGLPLSGGNGGYVNHKKTTDDYSRFITNYKEIKTIFKKFELSEYVKNSSKSG